MCLLTVSSDTRLDEAVDADDPLAAHGLGRLEGRAIGIDDDLGHAVMVAQVDEQQAAMVADAVHPAGKTDGLADIGFAKSGTSVAAVAVHHIILELKGARSHAKARCGSVKIGRKSAW